MDLCNQKLPHIVGKWIYVTKNHHNLNENKKKNSPKGKFELVLPQL